MTLKVKVKLMDKRKRILLILMTLIIVFVLLFFNEYYQSQKSKKLYEDARRYYYEYDEDIKIEDNTESAINIDEEKVESILGNENIVGWLYISGTSIDYPVLQGEDNDFFLYNNYLREADQAGSIYMDFRNKSLGEDDNYIIYGHKMKNGTMFSDLIKYVQGDDRETFLENHQLIQYDTLDGTTYWEIFSVYVVDLDSEDYHLFPQYRSDEKFEAVLEDAYSRSLLETGVEVTTEDEIMTLVTCSYWYDDARAIIRLVRKD